MDKIKPKVKTRKEKAAAKAKAIAKHRKLKKLASGDRINWSKIGSW